MAAFDRPWSSKCLSSTSRSHPYTGASTSRGRRNVGVGPGNQLPGPDQRPSVQFQPAILCNLKPVMTLVLGCPSTLGQPHCADSLTVGGRWRLEGRQTSRTRAKHAHEGAAAADGPPPSSSAAPPPV